MRRRQSLQGCSNRVCSALDTHLTATSWVTSPSHGDIKLAFAPPRPSSGSAPRCRIGTGAQLATHAVVFAQLVAPAARESTGQRSASAVPRVSASLRRWGIVVLLVQLRDTTTGRLLPGVCTRDLGPKMGRNGLDNGLMAFSHVRVPRTSLLSRFTSVSPSGIVTPSPLAQLAYGALVDGRALMVAASRACLSIAVTVATRHAARRRQFPEPASAIPPALTGPPSQAVTALRTAADRRMMGVAATEAATTAGARWAPQQPPRGSAALAAIAPPTPGAGETAVLDYPLHLSRLVPQLGLSLCLLPAAKCVQQLCSQAAAASREGRVDVLKRAHCVSAAAKAETTWLAKAGIETCRQACGGFGYSSLSGLPGLSDDFAVMPTWEGDNHLMALQGSRLLLQGAQLCLTGSAAEDLPEEVRFLSEGSGETIDQENTSGSDSTGSAAGARQACTMREVLAAAAAGVTAEGSGGDGAVMSLKASVRVMRACQLTLEEAARFHAFQTVQALASAAADVPEGVSPAAAKAASSSAAALQGSGMMAASSAWMRSFILRTGRIWLAELASSDDAQVALAAAAAGRAMAASALWLVHRTPHCSAGSSPEDQHSLGVAVTAACCAVRSDAVSLSEAWGHSDWTLASAIARESGGLYGPWLEAVKSSAGSAGEVGYWEPTIGQVLRNAPGGPVSTGELI